MAEVQGFMDRLEKAVIRLETVLSTSCFSKSTGNDVVNGINGGKESLSCMEQGLN